MTIQQSRDQKQRNRDSDCGCKEPDNATQKTINTERQRICDLLYEAEGNTVKMEVRFDSENKLFKEKKCLFNYTEENYRKYRNLNICAGTELIQTNDTVKGNVTSLTKWNKDLNGILKNISAGVKNVKSKFSDLGDAACKLQRCYDDSCNTAQKKALTGKASADCADDKPLPEGCADAENIFNELICMPKAMLQDIDSIFKSAADVVGIQVFSNIDTLDPLQKSLDQYSKDFKKQLDDIVKQREGDMKKIQEELVKSVQDITKAAMDRNNARSSFEGYYDATDFLCCPDCDCLCGCDDNNKSKYQGGTKGSNCDPKLKDCEKEICEICDEVKTAFCCEPEPKPKDKCAD